MKRCFKKRREEKYKIQAHVLASDILVCLYILKQLSLSIHTHAVWELRNGKYIKM